MNDEMKKTSNQHCEWNDIEIQQLSANLIAIMTNFSYLSKLDQKIFQETKRRISFFLRKNQEMSMSLS